MFDPVVSGVCDLGTHWIGVTRSEMIKSTGQNADGAAFDQTRETLYAPATDSSGNPDHTGRIRDIERQPNAAAASKQTQCTRVMQYDAFGSPKVVDVYPGRCGAIPTGLPAPGASTRRTIETRDPDGVHVAKVQQVLDPAAPATDHVTEQAVHWGLGVIQASGDANGQFTMRTFDGFGRPVREDAPDGSFRRIEYLRPTDAGAGPCFTDGFSSSAFPLVVRVTGPGGSEEITCRDRRGAARRVAMLIKGTLFAYVDTTYGSATRQPVERYPERVYRVTRPHEKDRLIGAPVAQSFEYDAAGRTITSCTAEPSAPSNLACATTAYAGLTTTTADPPQTGGTQVKRKQIASRFGAVESTSIFPDGSTEVPTTFLYGPFDTLVRVKDLNDNTVKQTFDELGRRTRLVDPDAGTTDTTYTAFDQIETETDARLIQITSAYDRLGRLRTRTVPGESSDEVFWDDLGHKGRVAKKTRGGVTRVFQYTTLGQLKTTTLTVDGASYVEDLEYDTVGRLKSTTTPAITGLGRVKAVPKYDDVPPNRLTHLDLIRTSATCTATSQCQAGETCAANLCTRDLWTETAIDPEGRTKCEWFGKNPATLAGILERSTGYSGGYTTSITTKRDATTIQDNAYTYQSNGNLKTRQNLLQLGALETFTYDGADRLRKGTIGATTQTWDYDALGNLTYASDTRPIATCVNGTDFEYTKSTPWGPVGPHAMSRVTCRGTPFASPFRYDAAGNDLYGLNAGDEFRWTSFGKLAQSTGKVDTWQLTYDADHQRVMKVQTASLLDPHPYYPWKKIIFAGPLERRFKTGGEQHILSIPIPSGSATFQLIWDWNGITGTPTVQFTHPDRLGSPELVTNAGTGTVVERRSFDAWGTVRASDLVGAGPWPSPTTISFTGHHDDLGVMIGDGWGFIDMGGRIYNPLLKRFWSPDPIVQDPTYGPSWNRYAYVFNNPLKFTDPTGYMATSEASYYAFGDALFLNTVRASGFQSTLNFFVNGDGRFTLHQIEPQFFQKGIGQIVVDAWKEWVAGTSNGRTVVSMQGCPKGGCKKLKGPIELRKEWKSPPPKINSLADFIDFLLTMQAWRESSTVVVIATDTGLDGSQLGIPGFDIIVVHSDGRQFSKFALQIYGFGAGYVIDRAKEKGVYGAGGRPVFLIGCLVNDDDAKEIANGLQRDVIYNPKSLVGLTVEPGPYGQLRVSSAPGDSSVSLFGPGAKLARPDPPVILEPAGIP